MVPHRWFVFPPQAEAILIFPGIHGYPLVQWDEEDPVAPGGFYCQHSTVVFPIWHRPYMLLLEVTILRVDSPKHANLQVASPL